MCLRCVCPLPCACVYESLPLYEFNLIEFQKFREIILQHPHKRRMNNRSVPLIKLCVRGSGGGGGKKWGGDTGGAEKCGDEIAKRYDF